MSDGRPRDRISLRDYVRDVEIGAFQAERGTQQSLRFNIVVEVQTIAGSLLDDVDQVLSYDTITEAIDRELAEERLNLLETLAERVADRILADPRAARAFVRIEKLDRGPFKLGVEIVRDRSRRVEPVTEPEAEIRPRVALLDNSVLQAPEIKSVIDILAEAGAPVILCVGPSGNHVPQASNALAQRRIDLLDIEQNAWVLAARDQRCVVVDARTELDWALRNMQICVWAPSKMVLDDAQHSAPGPDDPSAMAVWLADRMGACDVVRIGGPPDSPVPGIRNIQNLSADLL